MGRTNKRQLCVNAKENFEKKKKKRTTTTWCVIAAPASILFIIIVLVRPNTYWVGEWLTEERMRSHTHSCAYTRHTHRQRHSLAQTVRSNRHSRHTDGRIWMSFVSVCVCVFTTITSKCIFGASKCCSLCASRTPADTQRKVKAIQECVCVCIHISASLCSGRLVTRNHINNNKQIRYIVLYEMLCCVYESPKDKTSLTKIMCASCTITIRLNWPQLDLYFHPAVQRDDTFHFNLLSFFSFRRYEKPQSMQTHLLSNHNNMFNLSLSVAAAATAAAAAHVHDQFCQLDAKRNANSRSCRFETSTGR